MIIRYLNTIESINGWWVIGQMVVANLLGKPGIKIYDGTESEERLINALTFACEGDSQMLCYKPKARNLYVVNKNTDYFPQLITDVKYSFKCAYIRGRFFVLAYETNPSIRNWYCIDDRLDDLKMIKHNPRYELSLTPNCAIGWAYDCLSFFQYDDFTSEMFVLKISRDLKIERSTPFQFQYVSVGIRTLAICHDRSRQVSLVDIENGLVLWNLANCIYLNTGQDENSAYFLNLEEKVIYKYEEQVGLFEFRSISSILSQLHSSTITIRIIAETPWFFLPNAQILMLTSSGELVSLVGSSFAVDEAIKGPLSAPAVKISHQGLLGVRFGQDAYSPLSIYRMDTDTL